MRSPQTRAYLSFGRYNSKPSWDSFVPGQRSSVRSLEILKKNGRFCEARMQWLEREWKTMQIDIFELKCKQETMAEELDHGKPEHAAEVATGSDKTEDLGKIAKGMDELTKQMEELKSCMSKVESSGPMQSQKNSVQMNDQPFYPSTYHPPNPGQRRNPSSFNQPQPYHQPSFRSNTSFRPPTHKAKPQPRFQTLSQPPSPERETIELTDLIPIPCTYTELFPALVQQGLIAFLPFSRPMKNPGPSYNVNAYCAYHSGTQGHSTENCLRLKEEVQRLIIEG
ncbi:hypothetical protein CCACVL1_20079 [Corchorus capsularis]|uniref:Uncharacterized protein n=1 Tax=Corchorus capsularis TaxID=210143 RepID=A0A1R3HCT5_COCAP|nr:hypothetical protein CCACVL1_20079 [Corchorus capsularis]